MHLIKKKANEKIQRYKKSKWNITCKSESFRQQNHSQIKDYFLQTLRHSIAQSFGNIHISTEKKKNKIKAPKNLKWISF